MIITNATFAKETEKAICINWLNMLCWIPKSLVTITNDNFDVVDWFYKKELAPKADIKISSLINNTLNKSNIGLPSQLINNQ